jgi:hypothetical protein
MTDFHSITMDPWAVNHDKNHESCGNLQVDLYTDL